MCGAAKARRVGRGPFAINVLDLVQPAFTHTDWVPRPKLAPVRSRRPEIFHVGNGVTPCLWV